MALSVAGRMLTISVVVAVLGLAVVVPQRTEQDLIAQFDCLTMLPDERHLNEAQTLVTPCPIAVNIGQNFVEGVEYTPGRKVRVEFKVTRDSVSSVFCRASQVLMATPLGVWNSQSPSLSPYACLRTDDALLSRNTKPISTGTTLLAFWTPPSTPGNGDMEIVCTVVDETRKFWFWNSFILGEAQN